jgi:hypothetical protein
MRLEFLSLSFLIRSLYTRPSFFFYRAAGTIWLTKNIEINFLILKNGDRDDYFSKEKFVFPSFGY